jgi:PD-(D/E)XK nuclease superfamily
MKGFTWSYSRLKNFETCALKSHECDDLKHFKDESKEMLWGNEVHAAIASGATGQPVAETLQVYGNIGRRLRNLAAVAKGNLLIEQKYALTRELTPTPYFDVSKSDPKVWYRGIADAVLVMPPKARAWDHKTGKIFEDGVQLFLMAACVMAFHSDVDEVETRFIWLKNGVQGNPFVYKRSQLREYWAPVLDRVKRMEDAYLSGTYSPNPSGICRRHCPVTTCQFHGLYNNNAGR